MARKPYQQDNIKTHADGPMFVSFAGVDAKSTSAAFERAYSSLGHAENVVQRQQAVASDVYRGVSPGNVSGRDGFDRTDYEMMRPGEALPQRPKDIIRECMLCYKHIGIIRNVIDLMADFATQGVDLVHPNERIETFYKEWFRKVNGKERSERFLNYLYRTANVVVKRQTAKLSVKLEDGMRRATADADIEIEPEEKVVKREIPWKYIFQNPLTLTVENEDMAMLLGSEDFLYGVDLPASVIRAVKSPKKGQAGLVAQLPTDMVSQIQAGQKRILLDAAKTRSFFYKRDDWSPWAEPMVNAILADLLLLKKMRLADLAALDGAISSIRVWKLGSLEHKILPTELAINRLATMLMNNVGGGVMDLVWGPEIELMETSTEVHKFLGQSKYEPVLTAIHAGLGIPPTLSGAASAGGGGFTNNFISLKTLTERLQYGRDILRGFWEEEIRLVQRAMGFRFPATLRFDRMVLTDEAAEKALLIDLADRNYVSIETLQERFGEDPAIEQVRIRREHRKTEAGQTPPKAGPFHNPQQKDDLKKLVASGGSVAPSELGIQLDPKKPGEKTPLEMQAALKPAKDGGKKKKAKGVSGQGRPVGSNDKRKRKQKRVTTRTSAEFMETYAWAENAQSKITDVAGKGYLKALGKKNMRQLTTAETTAFENFKFYTLCNLDHGADVTEQAIAQVVATPKLSIPSFVDQLLKATVAQYIEKHAANPPLEVLRSFHSGAYAFWKGDYEQSAEPTEENMGDVE